ncbi:MAG: hypothetical protein LKK19_02015 [Bacteroidales bacterium]|jgi:hypothetical protein|nr:hypothetical protein [Bacteroidales bacterium]MCI2121462.1 hypothetical protein [Bacteroidales bacterium]MCI2145259.1 hypothetical protein [Bacteroidales bacterium]
MKKIFYAITLLLGFSVLIPSQAQTIDKKPVEGYLTYSNGKFRDKNNVVIEKEQLVDMFDETLFRQYQEASNRYRSGWISTGSGIGLVAVGTGMITLASEIGSEYVVVDSIILTVGFSLGLAGSLLTCTGIPQIINGNIALKSVANDYNYQNKPVATLNFGTQQHGLGLSLTF